MRLYDCRMTARRVDQRYVGPMVLAGTGPGLSIVRDIVAVHGAVIRLADGYGGAGLTL
jgi:nitrogen fixation/metabolism regulation signal transduction histidine kinase